MVRFLKRTYPHFLAVRSARAAVLFLFSFHAMGWYSPEQDELKLEGACQ
jgi:hypothetical protein